MSLELIKRDFRLRIIDLITIVAQKGCCHPVNAPSTYKPYGLVSNSSGFATKFPTLVVKCCCTNSLNSHRNVPSIGHQWREVIEPNSISAKALAFPYFLESKSTNDTSSPSGYSIS